MGRAGACLCARVSRGDRSRTCPLLCPLESSLRTGVLGGCHPWGSSSLHLRARSPHCHLRQAAVPKFPCPSPREKLPLRSPCLFACPRPTVQLPAVTPVTRKQAGGQEAHERFGSPDRAGEVAQPLSCLSFLICRNE